MSLNEVLGKNGATIKVGDKEFELSPLFMEDIAALEGEFGCDLEGFGSAFKKTKNIISLVFHSLKQKHPSIKIEEVGKMFKFSDMNDLVSKIMEISGMQTPAKNETGTAAA